MNRFVNDLDRCVAGANWTIDYRRGGFNRLVFLLYADWLTDVDTRPGRWTKSNRGWSTRIHSDCSY